MIVRRCAGLLAGLALLSGSAYAQEAGDTGLVMGFPASVGMVWHATDRLAIRPAIDFGGSSTETSGGAEIESESWTLGLSVGALFYLSEDNGVRTYVTPEFTFRRTNSNTDYSGMVIPVGVSLPDFDRSQNSYGASGSFGAQYSMNTRFSVFGEVGLSFDWASISNDDDEFVVLGEVDSSRWGTRGAVGIVLYF